jgi:hypothetical protein
MLAFLLPISAKVAYTVLPIGDNSVRFEVLMAGNMKITHF